MALLNLVSHHYYNLAGSGDSRDGIFRYTLDDLRF